MWNSQEPLKLLLSMPNTLNKENLEKLQGIIDVDKIINSQLLNRDLCGEYAPFCGLCDKSLQYPCAHAYVKMKQSEGLDVEVSEEVFAEQAQPEEAVENEETKQPSNYVRICQLKRRR